MEAAAGSDVDAQVQSGIAVDRTQIDQALQGVGIGHAEVVAGQQVVEVCVQPLHAAGHHEGNGDVDAARGRQVLFEVRQKWVRGAGCQQRWRGDPRTGVGNRWARCGSREIKPAPTGRGRARGVNPLPVRPQAHSHSTVEVRVGVGQGPVAEGNCVAAM
ncbi:MAG: hypothetical protein Q8N51_14355, partial [Gammaproteobacteria bacterium]|nr:hypothetical protein [Gammaproteobacteria bacterium]